MQRYANYLPWLHPILEIAGGFIALIFALMGLITFFTNALTGIGVVLMGAVFFPKIRKIGSIPITIWVRGGVFLFGFLLIGQGGGSTGAPVQVTTPSETTKDTEVAHEREEHRSSSTTTMQPVQNNVVIVIKITDGDTIKIRMPDSIEETVRIIGIDTPETRPTECFGREATEKMRTLVEGKTVLLEKNPSDDRDNFGRLLRYVAVNDIDAGAVMIRDGFAHSYKKFPHPRFEEYNALEREARNAYRGL